MDKRKVVYVCDVNNTTEFMTSQPVRALLDPLWEKYNVDFVTVQDQENLGMSFTQFAEKFEKTGPEWYTPPQKVLDAISDAEVILMNYVLAPKMFLDAAKQCRLLLTTRGGVENVNVPYATEKGIQVANSPFSNNFSVPDYTIALILAAVRRLFEIQLRPCGPDWDAAHACAGRRMCDLKIGLLGFGTIARSVAEKLQGFGCEVLVSDPFVPDETICAARCVPVTTQDLLAQADVVSVHVRLLPATRGMFTKDFFAQMKPTAWLVNTARSGLIDTQALLDALRGKRIAGAALDVFDIEPLPTDSPFYTLDNVLLTPHLAGSTCDTRLARLKCFLPDLEGYFRTGRIQAKVNFR